MSEHYSILTMHILVTNNARGSSGVACLCMGVSVLAMAAFTMVLVLPPLVASETYCYGAIFQRFD